MAVAVAEKKPSEAVKGLVPVAERLEQFKKYGIETKPTKELAEKVERYISAVEESTEKIKMRYTSQRIRRKEGLKI